MAVSPAVHPDSTDDPIPPVRYLRGTEQVLARYGMSRRTLTYWGEKRLVTVYKMGRLNKYDTREIDALIVRRDTTTTTAAPALSEPIANAALDDRAGSVAAR